MPVPVPTYSRLPAHPVSKPTYSAQSTFAPAAADIASDNARKYVIQFPCQPTAPSAGLATLGITESHSNWTSNKPFYNFGDDTRLASFLSRPRVAQESSGLQHRLIAADNVAISKQRHAEACHSPVRGSEHQSFSAMGLQRYSGHRGTSESVCSGYDADDDACAAPFVSNLEVRGFDQVIGHRIDYRKDTSTSDQCMACERGELASDNVMLQDITTPFAEYVDRIAASDATHTSGHPVMDVRNVLPPVDTPPRQQQPATAEPLTNAAYIKAYRAMAEPLSDWMADYVWKVCTTGINLPQRFVGVGTSKHYSEEPPSSFARSIHSLLCSTLLQPSAIVLALWYIARLPVFFVEQAAGIELAPSERDFRKELLGEGRYYPTPGERSALESRAPFRIILLGCMLANKWLDDHTFSNKTWQTISEVPIQSINCLERAALAVLSHDLSISPKAWEQWLAHLYHYQSSLCPYPTPIRRPSATDPSVIIRKVVEDLVQLQALSGTKIYAGIAPQPIFSPLLDCDTEKKVEPNQTDMLDPYEIDLDEDGPLREEYIPKRRSSHSRSRSITHALSGSSEVKDILQTQTSPPLPPPSEWSPQADPPLVREHGPRDKYFAAPLGSEHAFHGRSFSDEYAQHPAWGAQLSLSGVPFELRQANKRIVRPNHVFQSLALGFPLSTACPPISHTRSTLTSAAPPPVPAQSAAHLRSYSHSNTSNDGFCFPSISCAQYLDYPSAFSHAQGDPAHFRPLWLRT